MPRFGIGTMSVLAAIAAMAVVGFSTSAPGPGVTGDSLYYLGGAHALVTDGKLQYPDWRWTAPDSVQAMTRTTPGLSLALAGLMKLGASPVGAARIVQILSAGVVVGFATLTAGAFSGPLVGVLVGLSILALPVFNFLEMYILTEPLFLAAVVVGVWALVVRGQFRLAGVAFLVASITRFVGFSIAAGAALSALTTSGTWRTRVTRALALGGPSALFFVAWRWWVASVPGAKPMKARGFFPLDDEPREAFDALAAWIAPGSAMLVRLVIVGAIGLWMLALLGRIVKRRHESETSATEPLSGTESLTSENPRRSLVSPVRAITSMIALYGAFVVSARLLAEPTIEFGSRMWIPVFVLTQVLLGIQFARLTRGDRFARSAAVLAVSIWLCVSLRVAFAHVVAHRGRSLEIASTEFRRSPTLRWLEVNVRNRPVFTNNPLPVYYHADRRAKFWPTTMASDSTSAFFERLRATSGIIVVFKKPDIWVGVAPPEELASRLPLREVASFDDATVFELDRAATPAGRGGESPGVYQGRRD